MRRLLPDPGATTVEEQLDSYRPWEEPREDRPFVAMNFAATVDGRATIGGVSGPIGSDADTAMLVGLRTRFDAVMIGAGTMRAERYGGRRARSATRERSASPRPADGDRQRRSTCPGTRRFHRGAAGADLHRLRGEPPETATPARVRHEGGRPPALATCARSGRPGLLCEGGRACTALGGGLVDELFLTIAPKLAGGDAPRILEGDLPEIAELELAWLLEQDGELFARYRPPLTARALASVPATSPEERTQSMDFKPSPQVETLRERILDFMDEQIYPQEREIMEALDAEVAPGVPYPKILVEIRERAKARGALEPLHARRALRPRA